MKNIDELEWKDDEIEFWFESNEVYDTKEKRKNLKRIEKVNSLGLGSNTYNIEKKLRKDMKEWKWKEKEKMKYKKIDLANGYEEGKQWRIRMKVNSKGNINCWLEI